MATSTGPKRDGKFPVLIVRTPYGVQSDSAYHNMIEFAQRGYAVLVQDVAAIANRSQFAMIQYPKIPKKCF